MADNDGLLQRVNSLLRSSAVRKIDFTLGRIPVDYNGFLAVISALATGKIPVEVSSDIRRGAAAEYSCTHDVLRFKSASYGATNPERMIIVHECVHAMQDIRGSIAFGAWGAAMPTDS